MNPEIAQIQEGRRQKQEQEAGAGQVPPRGTQTWNSTLQPSRLKNSRLKSLLILRNLWTKKAAGG
jgi:hypothetical protein